MSTAATDLAAAPTAIRSIAEKASVALRGLRGGESVSYQEIGDAIGLDLVNLQATPFYLAYLSVEAALLSSGWVKCKARPRWKAPR